MLLRFFGGTKNGRDFEFFFSLVVGYGRFGETEGCEVVWDPRACRPFHAILTRVLVRTLGV